MQAKCCLYPPKTWVAQFCLLQTEFSRFPYNTSPKHGSICWGRASTFPLTWGRAENGHVKMVSLIILFVISCPKWQLENDHKGFHPHPPHHELPIMQLLWVFLTACTNFARLRPVPSLMVNLKGLCRRRAIAVWHLGKKRQRQCVVLSAKLVCYLQEKAEQRS